MTDYISREAAIDAIFGQFCASSDETEAALNSAIEDIKSIPAADVRPVTHGKWLEEDSASNRWSFRCSVCEKGGRGYKFNFCSNCGADMREES